MTTSLAFTVTHRLNVATEPFLDIFGKPASRLQLRGRIDTMGPAKFRVQVDGNYKAVIDYLSFTTIGAPAFGPISDIELWVDDQHVFRDEDALAHVPGHGLRPARGPREGEDAVVPIHYI